MLVKLQAQRLLSIRSIDLAPGPKSEPNRELASVGRFLYGKILKFYILDESVSGFWSWKFGQSLIRTEHFQKSVSGLDSIWPLMCPGCHRLWFWMARFIKWALSMILMGSRSFAYGDSGRPIPSGFRATSYSVYLPKVSSNFRSNCVPLSLTFYRNE